MAENAFSPIGNTSTMAVTSADASMALPSVGNYGGGNYLIYNAGPAAVFLAVDAAAVAPTAGSPANGWPVLPGQSVIRNLAGTNIHAITAASTATIYVTAGQGM